MKKNLFAKLGIATMCAFGTVAPVMSAIAPIHANDGQRTVEFRGWEVDKTLTLKEDTNVYAQPTNTAHVIKKLTKGTELHIIGETDNGWYRYWTNDPEFGGETFGYIPKTCFDETQNKTYTTQVKKGYLALRNGTCYDDRNIIGKLYNGCTVTVVGDKVGNYVYVRVDSVSSSSDKNLVGKTGYVDARYLI